MSHYLPGYVWLVERSRRLRYDSRAIMERYDEHVEDVLVHVFYALARLSGDPTFTARAERTEQALLSLCWDEQRGLSWDLAGRDHTRCACSPGPRSRRWRPRRCPSRSHVV